VAGGRYFVLFRAVARPLGRTLYSELDDVVENLCSAVAIGYNKIKQVKMVKCKETVSLTLYDAAELTRKRIQTSAKAYCGKIPILQC